MKKFFLLLSIALSLVACKSLSKNSASENTTGYTEEDVRFFITTETSEVYLIPKEFKLFANNPNLRKVTFLFNEKEPTLIGKENPLVINSLVKVYVFNCLEDKFSPKETYMYSEKFAKGELVFKRTIGKWESLESKGTFIMMKEVFCAIEPLPEE